MVGAEYLMRQTQRTQSHEELNQRPFSSVNKRALIQSANPNSQNKIKIMSQNNMNFKDLGGSTDTQTNNEIENLLNMSQNEIEKIKQHNNILYKRSGSNPVGASGVS